VELLLIRHGEAEPILEQREGGSDPPLTATGHDQARRLAAWYGSDSVDAIVASPLQRAAQTASPLAEHLGVSVELIEGLAEYDRAALTYVPAHLADRDDPEYRLMIEEGTYEPGPGGEDPEVFRERAVGTIEQLVERFAGVINVYLGHLLRIPRLLWFMPENASVSRVMAARSGQRSVLSVNETGHLSGRRG
jgi:probable phosphoglycerate mutase